MHSAYVGRGTERERGGKTWKYVCENEGVIVALISISGGLFHSLVTWVSAPVLESSVTLLDLTLFP